MASSPSNAAVKRLLREAREVARAADADFVAAPLATDLFEWHFVVRGPPGTDFAGGVYHGRILVPPDYPFKPPSFMFLTPNGRFETNTKICLNISEHHPESWQPSWSVRTALLALVAFFPTPPDGGIGSADYPPEARRELAARSRAEPPLEFGTEERRAVTRQMHELMLEKISAEEEGVAPPPQQQQQPQHQHQQQQQQQQQAAGEGATEEAETEVATAADDSAERREASGERSGDDGPASCAAGGLSDAAPASKSVPASNASVLDSPGALTAAMGGATRAVTEGEHADDGGVANATERVEASERTQATAEVATASTASAGRRQERAVPTPAAAAEAPRGGGADSDDAVAAAAARARLAAELIAARREQSSVSTLTGVLAVALLAVAARRIMRLSGVSLDL